jgi:hypothetical protein
MSVKPPNMVFEQMVERYIWVVLRKPCSSYVVVS